MLVQLGMFAFKALPKAMGFLLSPGKAKSIKFAQTFAKLQKSKTYKAAKNFLNEDPTEWAKRNLKKSFENGDALKFLGGVASGLSDAFSSFTPKPRAMPARVNPRTSSGAAVPGAKSIASSMMNTNRAYNVSVRNLSKIAVAPPKGASKKVFDQYRASFSKRNATLGELANLNAQVSKKAKEGVYSLGKNVDQKPQKGMLRNIPQAMKIRPAENMKESSSKELSNYIQSTINTSTETISKDIDIVNQNLEKVMSGLAKAQSDSNKALAMNLGNFTAQNISELARIITKSEETAFRKQQESSYYQTEVLSNKMDESHRYNAASLNAVREDILANTQSMYALEQESRRIDAEYREYEERKNAGVTLPALYGLTKQVGDMVQMTFRSHSEYNQAAQSAFRSLVGDFGYEIGKMVGFLKEAMAAHRLFMCTAITKVEEFFKKIFGEKWGTIASAPITAVAKLIGKASVALDGFIFKKLLGVNSSAIEDAFGLNDTCFNFSNTVSEKDDAAAQERLKNNTNPIKLANSSNGYLFGETELYGASGKREGTGFSRNGKAYDYEVKGNKVTVQTPSGYKVVLDYKKPTTKEEYVNFEKNIFDQAIVLEAAEAMESGKFDNLNKLGRDDKKTAQERYINNVKLITSAYVNYKLVNGRVQVRANIGGKIQYPNVFINHGSGKNIKYPEKWESNFKDLGKYQSKRVVYSKDKAGFNKEISSVEVRITEELINRVTLALKQAMLRGIPVRITDTIRQPAPTTSVNASSHFLGVAVDANVGDFESLAGKILKGYYTGDKGKLHWSAIISSNELEYAINNKTSLKGVPLSESELSNAKDMAEWLVICKSYGLTTGVTYYPIAYEFRQESTVAVKSLIDLVHLQLDGKSSSKLTDEAGKDFQNNWKNDMSSFSDDKDFFEDFSDPNYEKKVNKQLYDSIGSIQSLKNNTSLLNENGGLFFADYVDTYVDGKKHRVYLQDHVLDDKGNIIDVKTALLGGEGNETYSVVRNRYKKALDNVLKERGVDVELGGLRGDDIERIVDISHGTYDKELEDIVNSKLDALQKSLEELKNIRSLTEDEKTVLNLTYVAQQTTAKPSVDNDLAQIDDPNKKLN